MNTPQLYKGHKSYINYLGRFVAVFEDVINKQMTSEQQFKNEFPQSFLTFQNRIKKNVGHATRDNLSKVLNRKNITLAYNGNNCLVYELCRHIRNSFCHLMLEVDGNKMKIIDKYRNKLSSDGWIDKDTFLSFIKSVVNEYENKV